MTSTCDNARQKAERSRTAWEFWPARLFELPYYLALLALCLWYRLPPKQLAKANYALDHGEIGLGSKHATQLAFDQRFFPRTLLLPATQSSDERAQHLREFAAEAGYPVILKPDMGAVGKGLLKATTEAELLSAAASLPCDYLAQAYVDLPGEFGVFVVRFEGQTRISGHQPQALSHGDW